MTIDEIRTNIRERLAELTREQERLEDALAALDAAPIEASPYGFKADGTPRKRAGRPPKEAAPFGYKADGTPRKRPAPTPELIARQQAGRERARQQQRNGRPKPGATLRVQTVGTPERELVDRRVAYSTEEPA